MYLLAVAPPLGNGKKSKVYIIPNPPKWRRYRSNDNCHRSPRAASPHYSMSELICRAVTAEATYLSQKYSGVATTSCFLEAGPRLNCAFGSEHRPAHTGAVLHGVSLAWSSVSHSSPLGASNVAMLVARWQRTNSEQYRYHQGEMPVANFLIFFLILKTK